MFRIVSVSISLWPRFGYILNGHLKIKNLDIGATSILQLISINIKFNLSAILTGTKV